MLQICANIRNKLLEFTFVISNYASKCKIPKIVLSAIWVDDFWVYNWNTS